MATSMCPQPLGELHMIVLAAIALHRRADVEEIAAQLGMPTAIVETVRADLEAAGFLMLAVGH